MADFESLQRLLARHYDLSGITVTPAPRGFVAETFVVEHQSDRFFAKIVPQSRHSAHFESSLPVLAALSRSGVTQIPQDFPAVHGGYSVASGSDIVALFSYIAGASTFEYDFEKYFTLIATIHCRTQDRILCALGNGAIVCVRRAISNSSLRTGMLRAISSKMRAARFILSIGTICCWRHASAISGSICAEAECRMFLGYYRRTCPGYQVNYLALHFYLSLRYLDDLEGFINRIVEPGQASEKKKKYLALPENDCLACLRPWVRRVRPEA